MSQMWSLSGILTVLHNILLTWLQSLYDSFIPHSYFDVPEFTGVELNHLYRHVELYLNSLNPTYRRHLTLFSSKSSTTLISYSVAPNNTVSDTFRRHRLYWTRHVDTLDENRSFTLKLPKWPHRHSLLSPYLDHVSARAAELERTSRDRHLFTNNGGCGSFESVWSSVPFRHPSTFQTLALEPGLKKSLVDDLTAFADDREFYRKIGRAWKRGYLLYGPPGSGKSSLIAAMANFLRYDVYDLELSKVSDNSELRALLIQTTNRSIVVLEDIDCSIDLTSDRSTKIEKMKCAGEGGEEKGRVSLSGILNLTDGLWSCCEEERVIVFTTSQRENVDPAALLRCRGHIDMHVSLGTCGMHAFRTLVRNYLGLGSHVLFDVVESCMRSGGTLTPAQIAEMLLRNRRDADSAIGAVVLAMQAKILGADGGIECDDIVKSVDRVADRRLCGWPESLGVSPEKFE